MRMRRMRKNCLFLIWILTLAELIGCRRAMLLEADDPTELDDDLIATSGDEGHGLLASSSSSEQSSGSTYLHPKSDDTQLGCQELTSKRYISDGFCTSVKPVTERVCGGYCLPIAVLPWYAEYVKVWARTKTDEWRCVEDRIRRRWVTLLCQNGETRRYPIRVVAGCRCKRFVRSQNRSHTANRRPASPGGSSASSLSRTDTAAGLRDRRRSSQNRTETLSSSSTDSSNSPTAVPQQ